MSQIVEILLQIRVAWVPVFRRFPIGNDSLTVGGIDGIQILDALPRIGDSVMVPSCPKTGIADSSWIHAASR